MVNSNIPYHSEDPKKFGSRGHAPLGMKGVADSLITCLSAIKCYHAEFGRSMSTGVGTGGENPTNWESTGAPPP